MKNIKKLNGAQPSPWLLMREVAHHFRTSERWLRDWLHDHPPPAGQAPYGLRRGRDRLFCQEDITRIEAHMRELAAPRGTRPIDRDGKRSSPSRSASAPSQRSALTDALRLARER